MFFFSCKITCLSVCILFRQNIHVLIVNYRIYKLKYKYWYSYFNKSLTFAPSICFWHRFHVHRRRQYHCDQPVLLSLRVPAVRPIVHAVAHSTTPPAVRVRRAETLRMCALQQLVSPQRYAGQAHGKQARHLNRKKKRRNLLGWSEGLERRQVRRSSARDVQRLRWIAKRQFHIHIQIRFHCDVDTVDSSQFDYFYL